MHESFFGLQKRPFLTVPTLDRYCPVASQEAAFQSCARAVARAEGPVAILGGTGLGKSMVCLRIGEVFRRNFEIILLASSQLCSRRALLQSLLFELRMPYRDLSEGELRLSLLDRLQPSNENPSDGLVLIVDEAQTLSIKLLEELRLITNLTRDGIPRVRLVLCGTMRLEEMLGHPQMESLNQRLACRCYLAPLNQHETLCYLTHKVELCGATIHSTFTDDSMRLIHRATDGVPRLIDQLADQSLRLAAEARQRPVSAAVIEAAWASLQQLPLPWSDNGTPIVPHETTIEYGSLAEDGESDFANEEASVAESYSPTFQSDTPAIASIPSPLFKSPIFESPIFECPIFESQAFERPMVSPIPSAGMGLSSIAALVFPPNQQAESIPVADVWDDFITPGDTRFETGPIDDYVEEMLDFRSDSSPQSVSQPATIDYQSVPSEVSYEHEAYEQEAYEPSFNAEQVAEEPWGTETVADPCSIDGHPTHPSTVSDDLFGSDFDEEIIVNVSPRRMTELQQCNFDLIQNLTFEINATSQPCDDNSLAPFEDISLQPYSELLDSLTSANLEAMTLDPTDSLGAISFDNYSENLPVRHEFEGGLARQTRSSILSFADLQQNQQSMISDDRDLLIVEDDLPTHGSELIFEAQTPATVHPYKQLFSKLRG